MARIGPISRDHLIRNMRKLGFHGPEAGAKHQAMARGSLLVRIPNPHGSDIGVGLLKEVLRQAGISKSDWEQL
ncbi:MAG TPA: type II toxin-antitoxin system HicA family toxin [Candidatus Kapabacteria bacterium]|jgi:predicted RNA binding protein YcfA (HicA-like mRNA interferase family)